MHPPSSLALGKDVTDNLFDNGNRNRELFGPPLHVPEETDEIQKARWQAVIARWDEAETAKQDGRLREALRKSHEQWERQRRIARDSERLRLRREARDSQLARLRALAGQPT